MPKTRIEWTEYSWNPVTGCTPISEGCQNCYARRMANRLRGRCGYPADDPFLVTLHPERLEEPLKWRNPRRVFVCSMGDLFHENVPFEYIAKVWQTMNNAEQHTFLVLTKRPKRMKEFLSRLGWYTHDRETNPAEAVLDEGGKYTLPNVWLGVTAENQQRADERIPILLQIPAAVRFVSVEPMLGQVDLSKWLGGTWYCETCECIVDPEFVPFSEIHYPCENYLDFIPGIDWVICGGESGHGARPMHPEWVRSLKDQCQEAGVPFFFKQWGEWFPRDQWEWNPELILPDDEYAFRDGSGTHVFESIDGLCPVHRVGKKAAGRILDGQIWDEMPEI